MIDQPGGFDEKNRGRLSSGAFTDDRLQTVELSVHELDGDGLHD
jgi:hypothetical protein